MANVLKMAVKQTLITLSHHGWSHRRIASELGIHRETVGKYVREAQSHPPSKPANAPPGSEVESGDSSGPVSQCEPYRPIILEKLQRGLSATRIHLDLIEEHSFTGSYYSVRRFVKRLKASHPLPFRRMECPPGQEAQVDFGTGAPIITPTGKRRKTYVFRMVLSHSRKGYSESVFHQSTEAFLRCLENAFWAWGGVPQTLVIDNFKAAVCKADWYDPELNPKLQSFCLHYHTTILPTKPYTPRHKGKVESGVGYVQDNGLKGRRFSSLGQQNQHLGVWESSVADTRIHGTTRKQVGKVFKEVEQPALQPLPVHHFPSFNEAKRRVHRDGHVEVDKAYYSVPPEYLGRDVWVRWDSRLVRIFNSRMEQITLHARVESGRFQTRAEHIPDRKRSGVEKGRHWLLSRIACIGPHCQQWAEALLEERGIEGIRVLQGVLSLTKQYRSEQIETACRIALSHHAFRLRTLRDLLKRGGQEQRTFEFIDEHPIIRGLSEYDQLVQADFSETESLPL